ncbi:hypothetical protein AB0D11_48090 [Streptomyces monashensis]|uniref:hypothetical protein n=1 Tax=Streptomyces monashensis TaxID=1678012 RepID=UPI003401330B
MPARIVDEPLGIECVLSNATTVTLMFGTCPNPVLARELLSGVVGLVHPHGRVDAPSTVEMYVNAARAMVKALDAGGFTGSAAGLSRARLAEYLWGLSHQAEAACRRMLTVFDEDVRVLRPEVRELVRGRAFNRTVTRAPLAPYGEREWQRLQEACRAVVRESYAAHQRALAAAEEGQDPREGGWSEPNVHWQLVHRGPTTAAEIGAELGWSTPWVNRQIPELRRATAALFPDVSATLAYRLLFATYAGVVPDGVDDLSVEGLDWAGDGAVLLDYLKGRTAKESTTLNRRGVRLLEQWLRHSELSRRHAPREFRDALWLRHVPGSVGGPWHTTPISTYPVRAWMTKHQVVGDDGKPLKIHESRIRTTYQSLRERRSWFGSTRATVDPNHTPRVEGDHYLTVSTPAQKDAVETIIEEAQGDLLRKSRPPLILTDDQAADLAGELPGLVAGMNLDDSALAELLGGERDVFVAACTDPLSGLHGPAGKPCPARPWICLLCPLAIFAPRHVPNLMRMKAFFSRQWKQTPAAQFMAVFGPYAQRVDEVLDVFRARDAQLVLRAADTVADTDDELPLLPEERTQ